jgi:hypothetical protein
MMTVLNGIVKDGTIQLDEPLDLPEDSRIRVTVEPVPNVEDRRAAYEALKQLMREHPIDSGGLHFTRDELYERD